MPSTRKQKAKEKCFRQSVVMSDLENMDIMLGNYSRNDVDCQSEERAIEGDFESNGLQGVNTPNSEDFRSLINTNSRENTEITRETARMINNEITSYVTRKLDDITQRLFTQILEVIDTTIAEKVLPSILNVLGVQKQGLYTKMDHRSGGLNRSTGHHFSRQYQENRWKTNTKFGNQSSLVRESSEDFQVTDQDCDITN